MLAEKDFVKYCCSEAAGTPSANSRTTNLTLLVGLSCPEPCTRTIIPNSGTSFFEPRANHLVSTDMIFICDAHNPGQRDNLRGFLKNHQGPAMRDLVLPWWRSRVHVEAHQYVEGACGICWRMDRPVVPVGIVFMVNNTGTERKILACRPCIANQPRQGWTMPPSVLRAALRALMGAAALEAMRE